MPLIPIFLPRSGSATSSSLAFVDSTGLNPLPPGVIVTLTAGNTLVAKAMLQASGIMPITLENGTYLASFVGTQAPLVTVEFTTVGIGSTVITVPNYMSPVYSGAGYAMEAAYALVLYWHDVTINSDWLSQ
jgi:hypothetical protein